MADEQEPSIDASSADQSPQSKTLWHRLLAAMLEMLLTPLDIIVQSEVQVMSDPPKVDMVLLRRAKARWTEAQMQWLPDGVRDSNARHTLMEFKYSESLNRWGLQQGLGYDYFYRQSQRLSEDDVQTFVISARTPNSRFLERYGYVAHDLPGVYHSNNPLLAHIPLLVLNELRDEPHNAFIQCFASRKSVRKRAFARLAEMSWDTLDDELWDFVIGLKEQIGEQGGAMSQISFQEGLTPEMVKAIGKGMRKALIDNMTIDERRKVLTNLSTEERQHVLAELTPEDRMAGLAPEDRVAGLAPEDRVAGLAPEDRLVDLGPIELAALMARIEAYLSQQQDPPSPSPSDKGE